MRSRFVKFLILAIISLNTLAVSSQVQAPKDAAPATASQRQLPLPTTIKKTVVFLTTSCVHDFSQDYVRLLSQQTFTRDQRSIITAQLDRIAGNLLSLPVAAKKLPDQEVAILRSSIAHDSAPMSDAEFSEKARHILSDLVAITAFTDLEISHFTDDEMRKVPSDDAMGTGFLIAVNDARIPLPKGETGTMGFTYLVTNRHVAEPGVDTGQTCKRLGATILLNHKPDAAHALDYGVTERIDKTLSWQYPIDDSVDLAAAAILLDSSKGDYEFIPDSILISDSDITEHRIVEGDPVLFAGLFIQSFNEVHTLEPIIRSGSLAMIPQGPMRTVLQGKPGHIFFTEAHAFHGNSGSPVFIDENKFNSTLGSNYKFLGVMSGEVYENADLTLSVTTTLAGSIGANSDVSIIVPATEVRKLLDQAIFKDAREASIKQILSLQLPPQNPKL
jgi:hypothetical protein